MHSIVPFLLKLFIHTDLTVLLPHIYRYLPVLKLRTISHKKMVSEMTLKMILLRERSSLKKEMATGRMIRLAMRRRSMQMSQ